MIFPWPRHFGQVCCTEKNPCCMRTWPAPLQVGHWTGLDPRLAPAAGAGAAGYQLGHPDLDRCAGYGILKAHFQVVTQVRSGLPALAAAPLRTENIAEYTVEYVAEPAESLGIRPTGRGADSGMAELVICRPLLLIAQDIVGFFCFL